MICPQTQTPSLAIRLFPSKSNAGRHRGLEFGPNPLSSCLQTGCCQNRSLWNHEEADVTIPRLVVGPLFLEENTGFNPFPLTTASPTLQGALEDGFGEAVVLRAKGLYGLDLQA